MPHVVIEYSSNLKESFHTSDVTAKLHDVLSASGLFAPQNLKTRAYEAADYCVGLSGRTGSFVHITLSLMEGRMAEQKQSIGAVALVALRDALPDADQITVDIRDMARDTYQKYMK